MRPIDQIVVHCTATPPDMDIGAAEIEQWHRQRGWSGIGYHKVVRRDGQIELGRDPDQDGDVEEHIGAHAYGHNRRTLAVVYAGGVDANGRPADTRTPAQTRALIAVCRAWIQRFKLSPAHVVGHHELDPGKACPSFPMAPFRESLIAAGDIDDAPLPDPEPAALIRDLPILRDPLPNPPRTMAQVLLRKAFDECVKTKARAPNGRVQSIAEYQRANGLTVDGICGGQTWHAVLDVIDTWMR